MEEGSSPIHLGTQFTNQFSMPRAPASPDQAAGPQPKKRPSHPGRPPQGGTLRSGSSVDGCLPHPGHKGTSKLLSPGSNLHRTLNKASSGKPAPAQSTGEQEALLEARASLLGSLHQRRRPSPGDGLGGGRERGAKPGRRGRAERAAVKLQK